MTNGLTRVKTRRPLPIDPGADGQRRKSRTAGRETQLSAAVMIYSPGWRIENALFFGLAGQNALIIQKITSKNAFRKLILNQETLASFSSHRIRRRNLWHEVYPVWPRPAPTLSPDAVCTAPFRYGPTTHGTIPRDARSPLNVHFSAETLSHLPGALAKAAPPPRSGTLRNGPSTRGMPLVTR